MWIELSLPKRKVFLIHKKHIRQEQEIFRPFWKYSLLYRAIRIGSAMAIAIFYVFANLLIWVLIISTAFMLKHWSDDYPALLWLAWGVVAYRAAHLILSINASAGDPISRRLYRMEPDTLQAWLPPDDSRSHAYCRNKLLRAATSKGEPVNSWERAEIVTHSAVTFLPCLFFVAGWLPTNSFSALGNVLLIVIWLCFDLLLLGLPSAMFGDVADLEQFGGLSRITFEFIKIAMSFGMVATAVKHFKLNFVSCETYIGTLTNLAKYLEKYSPVSEQIAIYDCGIAPKDALASDLVAQTPADIQVASQKEVTAISESIDRQVSEGIRIESGG